MSSQTIHARNLGPVEDLGFNVIPGKVNVLKGRNGSGKSYTLRGVQAHVTGHGTGLTNRDGTVRGELEAFGATLKVARSVRRVGELEVISLEGRFNVADLVDPGIKSPDAADAQRIKALVQLAGGSGANPALFYSIVGGQADFEKYVSPSATETDDLVTMAARIKRDLEKHARLAEDEAKRQSAKAEAARAFGQDIDLSGNDDSTALQTELELAIAEHSRVTAEAAEINRRLQAASNARARLAAASGSYQGPSVAEAQEAETSTRERAELATQEVHRLEMALHEARNAAQVAQMQHENATRALSAAIEHGQTLAAWNEAIEAAVEVDPIPAEVIQQAAADVTAARQAVEQGALIRQAKQNAADADSYMHEAAESRRVADWLRDAGKATDDVLSDLVGKLGVSLRVSGGRLVTDHAVRGETFYGELSDGERWKLALDIAIDAVGPNGLLVIEQRAWQDLDPINRKVIIDHVATSSVAILTAECDAGELRAEVA